MDYGKILTRSFEVVRKHRALWFFGILLALFGGGGGGGNGSSFNIPSGNNGRGDTLPGQFPQLGSVDWSAIAGIIAIVICVIVILGIVGLFLRFVSRAALIGLVNELEATQTTPTVRHGFSIGFSRFWSLLGIALLVNIPLALFSFAILVLAGLPLIAGLLSLPASQRLEEFPRMLVAGGVGTLALFCCVILILILLALVIHPFYEFIMRVCVISKRGAMDSIREGYRLVRANLGKVIVLYILMIGVGIGFGIAMIPIALILIGIPAAVGIAIYFAVNALTPALIAGAIIGIPMVLVLIFIAGLYHAFESTVWTEGYLHVTQPANA